MDFIQRIGYDLGATRLEESLAFAGEHDIHYLDFSADTGPNRVDNWPQGTPARRPNRDGVERDRGDGAYGIVG